ncbi:MAG: uracil-DNA glycosylase [Buchnera aphidicola (Periphyllus lyropictus)]|uniref:uracil-DNA glycosylase n=1 Tax=Buchnera aphidicola TaxID=9 RepID=UPI001EC2D778|nr:uracil-DNA glycosylase [Buchnera aphidicola]NIH16667.1 uracil-DNA glycosylase [Buchnera aphidicola (Periphyllus lyropictus)]USS94833.1 uracil-DNA glycosylase [Buchnera aphidicola (Periphyllus lyropictus)]
MLFTWKNLLKKKKYKILEIVKKINKKRIFKNIFPKKENVFHAFFLTKFKDIKVVILGQDPYFKKNQAHGLSFSVKRGVSYPPSLRNIFKEIKSDIKENIKINSGCLENWSKQGVFLLNSILTVSENKPGSHIKYGWEKITDYVISLINLYHSGVVFLLWGKYAKKKSILINKNKNYILTSSHPSPLSAYRSFFGCKHFSKTNKILVKQNKKIINWSTK